MHSWVVSLEHPPSSLYIPPGFASAASPRKKPQERFSGGSKRQPKLNHHLSHCHHGRSSPRNMNLSPISPCSTTGLGAQTQGPALNASSSQPEPSARCLTMSCTPLIGRPINVTQTNLGFRSHSMSESCDNCRFSEPYHPYEGVPAPGTMECHRYPPNDEGWPVTWAHQWCGEWQALAVQGGTKDLPAQDGQEDKDKQGAP